MGNCYLTGKAGSRNGIRGCCAAIMRAMRGFAEHDRDGCDHRECDRSEHPTDGGKATHGLTHEGEDPGQLQQL